MDRHDQPWRRYIAFLRLYAAITPEDGESAWQFARRFDALSLVEKSPGHWYRCADDNSLIEYKTDGSGQWHRDGKLPVDVDPATVVALPLFEVKSLRDEMIEILRRVPDQQTNHGEAAELMRIIDDLPSAERAARLLASLRGTLAQVPDDVARKVEFLQQAARQLNGPELLAGKARGRDVAGLLFISALAGALTSLELPLQLDILGRLSTLPAGSIEELGVQMLKYCWSRNLREPVLAALAALRSNGDAILDQARQGNYPEGQAEFALDIFYGSLLQALPSYLSLEGNYHLLSTVPGLTEEDKEAFEQKAEAAEERTVRLSNALVYAVSDVDLSRLREKQAFVAHLMTLDVKKADAFVRQTIDYEYFYPTNFRDILTGQQSTSPK